MLIDIVKEDSKPSWAPMRAASCLIQSQSNSAKVEMIRWLTTENTKGLAILLTHSIDQFSTAFRKELISAAMNGPHRQEVESRLIRKNLITDEKNAK